MSVSRKVKYYLIHSETGQRYPVGLEEVVIGRSSGDLLFPDDTHLSNQHCRIFWSANGLGIHDMGSANGTFVDGKRLSHGTVYGFKPGSALKVGQQEFRLQEAGYARKPRNKPRRPRKRGDLLARIALTALLAGSAVLGWKYWQSSQARQQAEAPSAPIESPLELVEKEVRAAFDLYKQIGSEYETGKMTERQMAGELRRTLIPALQSAQVKLSVVRGQTEYERRKLDNMKQTVAAMIGQVTAMAEYAETKSPKAHARLKTFGEKLSVLAEQAQAYKRKPAQN